MSDLLQHAAARAAARPHFLAHALFVFRTHQDWDESQLATYLGCQPDTLALVGLCRRPRQDPAKFRDDIQKISERFSLEAERLAMLVRFVDAMDAFQAGSQSGALSSELLAAARDREADHEADSTDEDEP